MITLAVTLPTKVAMTMAEFCEFCHTNCDLRIERSTNG
jgi:hypothetical protein